MEGSGLAVGMRALRNAERLFGNDDCQLFGSAAKSGSDYCGTPTDYARVVADGARTIRPLRVRGRVLSEIGAGDPEAAERRLEIVNELPVLELNDDVRSLVNEYVQRLGLIGRARADLPHLAFAVVYEMDYLLTWNCAHIANGEIIRRLMHANRELNRWAPLILTPEEILEPPEEEET
jgi:hypothetical protein